jgi:hypothetical protein
MLNITNLLRKHILAFKNVLILPMGQHFSGSDMDFPAEWVVLQMEDFNIVTPSYQEDFTVELPAPLRSSGRILDGFRFALDGLAPLNIAVDLKDIFPVEASQSWKLSQEFWEQNINIRRNMVSSAWVSITDSAASRDCNLTDNIRARVPAGEFIRSNAQLPGMGPNNAFTRCAIIIGGDFLPKL